MTGRGKTTQVRISWAMALVILAFASALAGGCGDRASLHQSVSAAHPQSVATITSSAPEASVTFSLHQRVMAEQGRIDGATAARPAGAISAETTSTGASQSNPTMADSRSVEFNGATTAVLTGGQTPLKGLWGGTAEQLTSFLVDASPSARFSVPVSVLAQYYVRYCAEAGLRADLLWAQMIHETGYGTYGGDVSPEQNNYAGVGASGGGEPGASFPTAEAGVMAHVGHMVAYVYASSPVLWANVSTDPRFELVNPRGAVSVLADLNGRWAIPGSGYGQRIEEIARAINTPW